MADSGKKGSTPSTPKADNRTHVNGKATFAQIDPATGNPVTIESQVVGSDGKVKKTTFQPTEVRRTRVGNEDWAPSDKNLKPRVETAARDILDARKATHTGKKPLFASTKDEMVELHRLENLPTHELEKLHGEAMNELAYNTGRKGKVTPRTQAEIEGDLSSKGASVLPAAQQVASQLKGWNLTNSVTAAVGAGAAVDGIRRMMQRDPETGKRKGLSFGNVMEVLLGGLAVAGTFVGKNMTTDRGGPGNAIDGIKAIGKHTAGILSQRGGASPGHTR